jgi:hypothetical protein
MGSFSFAVATRTQSSWTTTLASARVAAWMF